MRAVVAGVYGADGGNVCAIGAGVLNAGGGPFAVAGGGIVCPTGIAGRAVAAGAPRVKIVLYTLVS